ncbi:MAG TPA: AfsR/SARP family transcriptional regulator [Streptosporangiaceae bacterium]|nr:AfsR/SARP family transcriptional regulator [Streptosporangiaceae bacterium]
MSIEARVLGPLQVTCAGTDVTPTAPKVRGALALLLLHSGQSVPVRDLIVELWGDRPPRSVLTTLQTYILSLRKLLGRGLAMPVSGVAETILLTRPGGYQLRDTFDYFDLLQYKRIDALGQRALADGEHLAAAELLQQAQGIWRGPVLTDVRPGSVLEPEIKRLEEARLATITKGIEVRLRLGHHLELLADLSGLVSQYSLHENLHAQYMVALHRSGRRQEALSVYQRMRFTFKNELGLEPSRRLQVLQQAILSDSPALDFVPRGDSTAKLLGQDQDRYHFAG